MVLIYSVIVSFSDRDEAEKLRTKLRDDRHEVHIETSNDKGQRGRSGRSPIRDTRCGKLILDYMRERPNRTYESSDIEVLLKRHGYQYGTVSPTLKTLVAEGDLVKLDTGLWRLKNSVASPEKSC